MVNTDTSSSKTGTELSLGFYLAANGYDVWLTSSRGVEPTSHKTLKPTEEKFWAWSYDEMAIYDTPAYIDYITSQTGASKIKYIGHSQVS